jgi:16S rRNA (guanine527-N7)-methyltransferase
VYNLTSVRDPMEMVKLHLLDSLTAVPAFKDAANVLDVGAGGGCRAWCWRSAART